MRWVLWPTIRGPLVVGCIVVVGFVIGAFEVPLAVGPNYPPTLAEYALQATQDDLLSGESIAGRRAAGRRGPSIVLAALAVRLARDPQGG